MPNKSLNNGFRIAVLGAGWFGREAHLKNLLQIDEVEVLAASSRSDSSLQQASELVGPSLRTGNDWREILKTDGLDAVIISLTNDQHHAAAVAAFEAGLHVLCEKPLGISMQQCNEIIAAASASGRVLQVGHEMRFQRLYQQVKEMVDQGDLGQLQLMWCHEYRGPMRPGWRSSEVLTGGTIVEKNSHHFDLFGWLLEDKPQRVVATGGRNVLLDREILDNAQVLIEYESGARAMLELCLFAPYGGDTEIGVVGDAGRIDTWNQEQRLVYHRFESGAKTECTVTDSEDEAGFQDAAGRIDRGILAELKHFVQCCRTGEQPLTDGESAKTSVAICLAAQASIQRQESVTMDEWL